LLNTRTFIERNLSSIAGVLEDIIAAENLSLKKSAFYGFDARLKILGILTLLIVNVLSTRVMPIGTLYLLSFALAMTCGLFKVALVRKLWILVPLYTLFVALPVLFTTAGQPLLPADAPFQISDNGVQTALILVLRVSASVALISLLIFTTPWHLLLKGFRRLKVPRFAVFLIAMTYRYIYVLLHSANLLFLGRKSRRLGPEDWQSNKEWIGSLMGSMVTRSFRLSNEVYLAMQSRGYRGEPHIFTSFQLTHLDTLWFIAMMVAAAGIFFMGRM